MAFQPDNVLLPTLSSRLTTAISSLVPPVHTPSVAPIPSIVPNPKLNIYETAEHAGKVTLWVVCAIMFLSTLAFIGMAWRVPVQKRLFHVITTFITTFAFVSYFAMATGDGWSFKEWIIVQQNEDYVDTYLHIFREVYWARYVDWTLTTPLLLLDLSFVAGLNGADIIVAVVADMIMVLTGLFAMFGNNGGQKWGYYAIGWVAYLVIVYQLAVGGRRNVESKGTATSKFFIAIGSFTLVLWTLYPIVWVVGDGSRKLSVDREIISYAVLDVLAKPIFGLWLLTAHDRSASSTSLDGFWSRGLSNEGAVRLADEEDA